MGGKTGRIPIKSGMQLLVTYPSVSGFLVDSYSMRMQDVNIREIELSVLSS